ncbi:PREDICTED: RNA-directed DNA polymerase from mobile element jockey-like [Eufriesea mexicana]|uniref:RNA-directed DNA polymerase from mobile element jockey-like n=1 Tax=Eufriesea mexicana TaxID=516756 RepID=UPI00083C088B|nr:PREDICTED: RNA-directed DNA polymerase from mobile element jockey-like [Eufriesea mexicana]
MGARIAAPGVDGILVREFSLALEMCGERVRRLFDSCLRTGCFAVCWKRARVVLTPKPGKQPGSPNAYMPICLLDVAGKIFERILATRFQGQLANAGPDLSVSNFRFRQGRLTMDAVKRIGNLSEAAVDRCGVVLAVGVDIANAFNTPSGMLCCTTGIPST